MWVIYRTIIKWIDIVMLFQYTQSESGLKNKMPEIENKVPGNY